MAKRTPTNKPRIFSSHSRENKVAVRRLETALGAAGAEVWVDHIGIRGGDNLPERISEALEWCNTLLLIWSDAASTSRWVKLEWTNAIALEKAIIPCKLSAAPLPAILANRAYLNFRSIDQGITELLRALNLAQQSRPPAPTDSAREVAQVIHSRLSHTASPAKPKPPQTSPLVPLRSQPLNKLSIDDVKTMLREKDFFASDWNPHGKGVSHQFEEAKCQGQKLVIDHTTGLTWQQAGYEKAMNYIHAERYIVGLNKRNYGGHSDWRLPTIEEAMSLMEPKQHGDLYLDPMFDRTQQWIWTADKEIAGVAWVVCFDDGSCDSLDVLIDGYYVRAVRGGQSNI